MSLNQSASNKVHRELELWMILGNKEPNLILLGFDICNQIRQETKSAYAYGDTFNGIRVLETTTEGEIGLYLNKPTVNISEILNSNT